MKTWVWWSHLLCLKRFPLSIPVPLMQWRIKSNPYLSRDSRTSLKKFLMWNTKWLICTAVHFVIKCAVFWYFVGFEGYVRNIARGQKRLNILVVCYWISYMQTLSTYETTCHGSSGPAWWSNFQGNLPWWYIGAYFWLILPAIMCWETMKAGSTTFNIECRFEPWSLTIAFCTLNS